MKIEKKNDLVGINPTLTSIGLNPIVLNKNKQTTQAPNKSTVI